MLESTPKRTRISAAMRKVASQFQDTPESKLMLAIINCAAQDLVNALTSKSDKESAIKYLQYPVHAEFCGVDPIWVRDTFKRMGCFDDEHK